VRFYTRALPTTIAQRRVDEIAADLNDHLAHERARGTSDRRIALGIVSRMARGLIADASWRRQARSREGDVMKSFFAMLAIPLAIAAVGVVAITYGESDDAPGLVLIGILLVVAALAFGVRTAQRSR
jgi:hypothetical protein